MKRMLFCIISMLFAGCAGTPTPDWQMNAARSLERFQEFWLQGRDRLAESAFQNAKAEIAGTGNLNLAARAELIRCAMHVAGMDFSPCDGFDRFLPYAGAGEIAYFHFLGGTWNISDASHVPVSYRPLLLSTNGIQRNHAARNIRDPASRLIAASLLLQRREIDGETLSSALETASSQGWRRPLLAWLNVALKRAETLNNSAAAAQLKSRIDLVLESEP